MNRQQAHELLSAYKRGLPLLPTEVNKLLFLCGDFGSDALYPCQRMDSEIQREDENYWEGKSDSMVENSGRYYGSQAWFDVHYGLTRIDE